MDEAMRRSAQHLLGSLQLTMRTAAHPAIAGASETAGSLESRLREPPPTQPHPAPSPPQRSAPCRLSTTAGVAEATGSPQLASLSWDEPHSTMLQHKHLPICRKLQDRWSYGYCVLLTRHEILPDPRALQQRRSTER